MPFDKKDIEIYDQKNQKNNFEENFVNKKIDNNNIEFNKFNQKPD